MLAGTITHPDQIELRRSLHKRSGSHTSKDVQLSDLPFATRLIVFHLQKSFNAAARECQLSSEYLAVCKSCERCLDGIHLRERLMWHRHRGRRRRGGQKYYLMYFLKQV